LSPYTKTNYSRGSISYPHAMLSTQAILLSVVLGVLTIFMAVGTFMNYTEESLGGLILMVLLFAVSIYDTECLATGPCSTWSWIRTVLWCIIPIFMIVLVIMALVKSRRAGEMSVRGRDNDNDADA